MSVEIRTSTIVEAGTPQVLFSVSLKNAPGPPYDVSSDGQRFLVNVPISEESAPPITLVQNWTAAVAR